MVGQLIFGIVFGSACILATGSSERPSLATPSAPVRSAQRTPAAFTPDMPLSEAIDILRNSTRPPLNIVVYWKDLRESADIDRHTPIGFDGLPGLRLSQSLDILVTSLSATSPARIDYTVDHGVIVIATADAPPRPRITTRVYDVTDLAMPPARWTFSPMLYRMLFNPLRRQLGTAPGQDNTTNATPTLGR